MRVKLGSGFRIVLLCWLLGLAASAQARGLSLTALAHTQLWLDLLHFNQGGTLHGRGESYVDDPRFFLAADGRRNPLDELQADVAALKPVGSKDRCRFPARYRFLARRLGWREKAPFRQCPKYRKWRARAPDQRAVLIFPAAYLNSPSSMFGHVFLRLDRSRHPQSVLTSWAVSFAAQVNPKDDSILYAWKGIVGSYPGYFSVTSYADKLQEYNHIENRAIWEYPLNLTPKEIGRLVDHLWELRGIRFGYYFFDENCAYRLLGLVQVARPQSPMMKHLRLTEVPVDAVRTLINTGFVSGHDYRPSKEVKLRWQVAQLPASERALAYRLAHHPALAQGAAYRHLSRQQRFEVASVAYDFVRYRHRKGPRKSSEAKRSFALLRLINANTPAKPFKPVPVPAPPDRGHLGHLVSLGAGQRAGRTFVDLQARYTYHGWLDNSPGYLRGAAIKALDLTLRHYTKGDTKLQSLHLVTVRSLARRGRFIKPISWFVDAGLEQVQSNGQHLATYLQGGPGLSWAAGDFIPYVYLQARLEHNAAYAPFAESGVGSQLGLLYYHGRLTAQLAANGLYFTNGDWRTRARLGVNWALGRNDALRIDAQREWYRHLQVNQWSLSWRHFF